MRFEVQMMSKIKKWINFFQSKYNEQEGRRALILLYFQIVLILILITLSIMVVVLQNENELMYFILVISLLIIQLVALKLNTVSKYNISALLTMISAIIGPWVSIFFDASIRMGDVIPIVYIVLIIHLSSIFLSLKTTILLTVIQFIALIVLCVTSPALLELNMASLFSFFIIASVLVGLASYINKLQIEQIENQNQKYIEKDKEMRELLIHDSMTGLFNRAYINEIIKTPNFLHKYSIFMFDIDGLKEANDKFGHLEGDQLIVNTAKVIKKCFRENDIVARMGGDEFIAILPDTNAQTAETIRLEIDKYVQIYNKECLKKHLCLNLSYGYASSENKNSNIEDLMKIADDQMYAHKNSKT